MPASTRWQDTIPGDQNGEWQNVTNRVIYNIHAILLNFNDYLINQWIIIFLIWFCENARCQSHVFDAIGLVEDESLSLGQAAMKRSFEMVNNIVVFILRLHWHLCFHKKRLGPNWFYENYAGLGATIVNNPLANRIHCPIACDHVPFRSDPIRYRI